MIILIAAAALNNALGKDNALLWHLPNDFRRFKSLTTGHPIIMGRKTFESFPKPLPDRTHIIITRNPGYSREGCIVVRSLEKAIETAIEIAPKDRDVYIIGGGEIYKQSMAVADKIELTRVHENFEADTFFPEIDAQNWQLVFEEFHPKDEKHLFAFSFQTFLKK